VRYRKSGWRGSWKAVAEAPGVPVVPPPAGNSAGWSSSPEPYRGLSEAEKQNIWRQALPKMSFEDREKLRKRGY